MDKHRRELRLQIMLSESEIEAIDEWRFKHRMPSRSEAFRELLRRGLTATETSDD
jgi:metal-responsive CopG/Arc/MetJ family transcriptional regulator